MNRHLLTLTLAAGALRAGLIPLPNASFESPPSTYATPFVDSWQQTPPPDLGDPNTLQTGVFSNQPPADPFHIDNCNGTQALFLFATPQAAIFQDYDSTDYANPAPTHAFDATFEVGKSYALIVGVLGGTNLAIPMQEGTTLELGLYYRGNDGNKLIAASTTITNSGSLFTNATRFVDFLLYLPTVQATDPWAGRHIGVQLLSTTFDFNLMGGYWDLDNVRLTETPALLAPAAANGQYNFTLVGQPGLRFEILASTNIALPLSDWTSLGNLTNTRGMTTFIDPDPLSTVRFYQARQLP